MSLRGIFVKKMIMFIGLETYSKVGGLQNFNKRLIDNLRDLSSESENGPCKVHLFRDPPSFDRAEQGIELKAFGNKRFDFIGETLKSALDARILLIGHINLLAVAALAKIVNPRLRTILFVHGDEVWNGVARKRKFWEQTGLKFIDVVASVSQFTATVMAREYSVPSEKFIVYPNVVDLIDDRFSEGARTDNVVLCVSRLSKGDRRKNIDQLIRALAQLRREGSPLHLEIIGGGDLREELAEISRNEGIEDHVAFLGRVDDQALEDAYRRASIFALPSSKEGFGIVYLEAWLRRLPVICGSQGAAHEVVTNGVDGYVVDETSPQDIAVALRKLYSQPELRVKLGQSGHEKVKENYLNATAKANLRKLLA
jgi:glycosyltransferase involved in cell wall biosynthesis